MGKFYLDGAKNVVDSIVTAINEYITLYNQLPDEIERLENQKNSNQSSTGDTSSTENANTIGDGIEAKFAICAEEIVSQVEKFYNLLNSAILSGEYISNSQFKSDVIFLKQYVSAKFMEFEGFDDMEFSDDSVFSLRISLLNALSSLNWLIGYFQITNNEPDAKVVYSHIFGDLSSDDFDPRISVFEHIFQLNTRLLFIDREFMISRKVLTDIYEIKRTLMSSECQRYKLSNAIVKKCDILLYKFKFTDKSEYLSHLYTFEGEEYKPLELGSDSATCKLIDTFYTKDEYTYKSNVEREYSKIEGKKCTKLKDFFVKCHFYKNILKSESLLVELIEEFKTFVKENELSPYDKRNSKYCLNYLYNCRLSLVLKMNDNLTPTSVCAESYKIRNIQDSTGVFNYFPHLIIAEWYNDYINKVIANTDTDVSVLIEALSYMESAHSLAEQYLDDSTTNAGCFTPFKPMYSESLESYRYDAESNADISIYISSSFIIPVDYKKWGDRLSVVSANLTHQRATILSRGTFYEIHNDLRKENIRIEEELNLVKKNFAAEKEEAKRNLELELKDNQKNNVQILSIFAAIVIFASSTIQIFRGAETVKDAAIFMLFFAASLSIISILIYVSTMSRINMSKKNIAIVIFAIFCFLMLNGLAIWNDWGKTQINESSEQHTSSNKE